MLEKKRSINWECHKDPKFFCFNVSISKKFGVIQMKTEEMKTAINSLNELNESYTDFIQAMKGTIKEVKTTKHLWRDKNKSRLVRLGLALIVFPEPTPISETIGTFLVVAGAVQDGIRRRRLYADDVYKTFQNTLKEIQDAKHTL
jgi:FtsZ-binding cell division protein ZapB